jgi:hypothetical protein
MSHLIRQSVFTTKSQTSPHSSPTHSVGLCSHPNNKRHHPTFPLTPSVVNHSTITNLNPQATHSLRQSVFAIQPQTSPHSCPTHCVSLYSKTESQITPQGYSSHSFSLYSQTNHRYYPTIVFTSSVSIHNQITNRTPQIVHLLQSACIHTPIAILTPHLSPSLRQSLFTTQAQTSSPTCPNHSVSLYSKPNHKTNLRAVSLYSHLNHKLHPSADPLTPSV